MRILSLAKLRSLQRVVPSLLLFGISFSIYTLLFGIKMQASNQIGSLFHEEGQNVIRDVDVTTSGPSETKGTPGTNISIANLSKHLSSLQQDAVNTTLQVKYSSHSTNKPSAQTMQTHEESIRGLLSVPFPLSEDKMLIIGEQRSEKVFLTIGIPTINRKKAEFTYLKGTLQSIVEQTSDSEKESVIVLIFLADFNETLKEPVVKHIQQYYQKYLDSGFMQIMQAHRDAYPPLQGLKRNYNDAETRVKWRSKQVVDFTFMFYYGRNLSEYYIQIEDDVICAPNFVRHIKDFIQSHRKNWVNLEFSSLGFIGKLYKSADLEALAKFMYLFYQEQPVDWLYRYFPQILSYPKIPMRKPTLFQHMGEHSSLTSKKLNKLKDKYFAGSKKDKMPMPQRESNNPPARVYTTLQTYDKYAPQNAYSNKQDSYFWGKDPKEGDEFFIILNQPVKLKKISIETGHPFQKNDYLRNGVLEASPKLITAPSSPSGKCNCTDYVTLGNFTHGAIDLHDLKLEFPVKCLRIRLTKRQEEWLIVYQIAIDTWKDTGSEGTS